MEHVPPPRTGPERTQTPRHRQHSRQERPCSLPTPSMRMSHLGATRLCCGRYWLTLLLSLAIPCSSSSQLPMVAWRGRRAGNSQSKIKLQNDAMHEMQISSTTDVQRTDDAHSVSILSFDLCFRNPIYLTHLHRIAIG